MSLSSLTILGGGNTAFAAAANLTLAGFRVTLCELPSFRRSVEPLLATRQVALDGVAYRDTARLQTVTTDFAEALAENELVLLIVPAYAHRPFAEACAPYLQRGQTVVLMPGTLGSLEFVRVVRERRGPDLFAGPRGLAVAETDTAPYVCRKTGPAAAHIWGVVTGLGVGAFPAERTEAVCAALGELFAGVRPYPNVLACGLAAMNPVVHPAGVLLNAGRIEHSRGEFYFYEEGVTPAVCHLVYAVDRERRAVAAALGLDLPPVDEAFHRAGFGPRGDLWATINGSRMLTQLRAPGSLETRWLSEDVPYGLGAWVSLGERLRVPTPVLRSLIHVASAAAGIDFWKSARTVKELGIADMDKEQLLGYVRGGLPASEGTMSPEEMGRTMY
ncbi:MAG TPA: NAD/NADP octopine/nopaline dehydrogenase family protein [Gemmataceae bacterium]|nr:NAD/NADP octopine/nopaline dehydrogenase family protein [Gemmataceae bacterium]